MHKYAVLVSGRGSNLKAILESVKKGIVTHLPSLVLTENASAPALEYAKEFGVETCFIDPKKYNSREKIGKEIIRRLKKRDIDTICLAGFMRIVHENVINEFFGRILNIHPALLPAFPGLEAQRQALEAGMEESGCTVHFVDEGVDTGPIIRQIKVKVEKEDTVESLSARILEQEHKLYPQVLSELLNDRVRLADGKVIFEQK